MIYSGKNITLAVFHHLGLNRSTYADLSVATRTLHYVYRSCFMFLFLAVECCRLDALTVCLQTCNLQQPFDISWSYLIGCDLCVMSILAFCLQKFSISSCISQIHNRVLPCA